jgi:Cof subfamily protein (haloacid dehalogenase superfamily)
MENIQLFVFDIDGTLIEHKSNQVSAASQEAINQLKAAGKEVLIATGRAYYFIPQAVKDVVNPDFYVCINGQCLLDKDGQFIKRYDLDKEEVFRLTEWCIEHKIAVGLKMADAVEIYYNFDEFITSYVKGQDYRKILRDCTGKNVRLSEEIPMGMFLIGDDSLLLSIKNDYKSLAITRSYPHAFDVFAKGDGKSRAIQHVLEKLNIEWNNVMVFGDGENDIDMIQKAQIGVVMGNAQIEVQSHGDFVTKSVGDDGIVFALKHFNIL